MLDDDSLRAIGRVAVASMGVDVKTVDLILEMSERLEVDPLPRPADLFKRTSGGLRKKLDGLNSHYEARFSVEDVDLSADVRRWLEVAKVHHEARGQLIHAQWLYQGDEDSPRALGIYSGGTGGLELIPQNPKKFETLADRLFSIAMEGGRLVRRIQDARRLQHPPAVTSS